MGRRSHNTGRKEDKMRAFQAVDLVTAPQLGEIYVDI